MLRQSLRFAVLRLDAEESGPPISAAVLSGAAFGLAWGSVARSWMRLISTNPEFSVAGTSFIVGVPTVFGACAGLAFAARRRGWRGWRHLAPRVAVVATFLPFGMAGGAPLMLTVLVATLAVTQRAILSVWLAAIPSILLTTVLFGTVGGGLMTAIVTAAAITLTGWKWVARQTSDRRLVRRAEPWLERVVRTLLLLIAVFGFGAVSWGIVTDKPGLLAALYVLFYLVLLYPVFLGLRVGLQPFAHTVCPEPSQSFFWRCSQPGRRLWLEVEASGQNSTWRLSLNRLDAG